MKTRNPHPATRPAANATAPPETTIRAASIAQSDAERLLTAFVEQWEPLVASGRAEVEAGEREPERRAA